MADFVEGAVGEVNTAVADRKPAIGVIENGHVFADRGLGLIARLQNEDHFVVLQGQRPGEGALLFPGERVLEIVAAT